MQKFLIEVPHEAETRACALAVKILLESGSHFITHADFGCHDGDHRAWMIMEFEDKDDKGTVQEWKAEMTNPAHLKGWTATSLEPGNVVTVTGFRAKSGAPYLWVTSLSSSNGVELKAPK